MHQHCHRCGGELSPGEDASVFCPHCGAPQLVLQEYDRTVPAEDATPSDGAPPAPPPRQIEWKTAIRCAAFVAVIAAILSVIGLRLPVVNLLSYFWIFSASMTTLTLYQRHRPKAWMDARVGATIGFTTGLLLVAAVTFASSMAGVVARFGLHDMARFDADMAESFATVRRTSLTAASPAPPDWLVHFYDQPEFHAGMMLAGIALIATILLLLSTFGGAVGGLLRSRRRIAS